MTADLTVPLATLREYQTRVRLSDNHRYYVDKKAKPGTTTVIKKLDAPFLDNWKVEVQVVATARAAFANPPLENEPLDAYVARLTVLGEREREHERISNEAKKIGTDVHTLIETAVRRMLGETVPDPVVCEEALYRFSGWRHWAKDVSLTPLVTEARFFNSIHDYCGTVDLLALIEGEPVQLDWKPTDALWDERRLQSAAYRKGLVSMGWPEMEGAIVCVPRDGGEIEMIYAEPPGPELDAAFDAFLALLRVYRWQAEVAKRARASKKKAA